MQMPLFAVGEGVRDRILESNNISLNANLAKYREGIKAGSIGTLVLTTSLLSVLIALIIQIVLPIAVIVFAVKLFAKKK